MPRVLANLLLYQLAWLACVLGAAAHRPVYGYGAVAVAVGWHLWRAPDPRREGALLLAAVGVGAVFELGLVQSGWVSIDRELLVAGVLPLWMVALWAAFATTFNISLRSLRARPGIVVLLALAGAPLAYAAGERLGAFTWQDESAALLAIAAGWALLLPLLLRIARRFDGYAT